MGIAVKHFSIRWGQFARTHPDSSDILHQHALTLCEAMTSDAPGDQIDKMIASEAFAPLQKIVIEHHDALGLQTFSDREIALWVRTICFCSTMRAEQSA